MNPSPSPRSPFSRYGLAWLPIPLSLLAIIALWVADVRNVWASPQLNWLVYYGFSALGIAFIVIPAARNFLASGQASVLMLGCGVLMSEIGASAMPAGIARSTGTGFAIYNTSVLLSALCHFTGVAITSRRKTRLRRSAAWPTAAYAGGTTAMGLVIWLALTGRMPVFFVDGQGGTLLRSLVVSTAVALFILTAGLLWQTNRRAPAPFLYWYAAGLLLVAIGLAGSMAIAVKDSPLQWGTRFTQGLGLVYMCVAVLGSGKGIHLAAVEAAWRERALLAGFRQQTVLGLVLRYAVAVGAVAAALASYRVATVWTGPGLPVFITCYPAIMVVALLGGFGPGLATTVLAACAVDYWILAPTGQLAIASPLDRLALVIFTGMGLFISVVSELYRRARNKAAAYDQEQSLREIHREKEFLANILEHASQPFAVGYLDGRLGRTNHAFEQLTGYNASELPKLDWSATLTPPEWREMEERKLDELRRTGQPVRYEKEYIRKDGSRVPVELLVHLVRNAEGQPEYYYSFLADISERKRAGQEREITVEMLRLVNESKDVRELVRAATAFFHQQSGCEAVGVRLREGEDYPYYETLGFPPQFVLLENSLCARDAVGQMVRDSAGYPIMECMCGNVICGGFSPAKPFFNANGSFWTNNTTELLATTTEADRQARTRNRCNGEGYESVALIALRAGEERLGLLQLNDKRKGMFSASTIALWERLAGYLAVALAKLRAEETQSRLAQFPEENPNPVMRIAQDGTLLYANSGAREFLAAMDGGADRQLPVAVRELVGRAARECKAVEAELANGCGQIFWFAAVQPQNETYVNLYGRDVTSRKQAEDALRESEAVLRSFFDSPGVMRGFVDLVDGNIIHVSCNTSAAEMFGVGRDSISGKSVFDAGASEKIARSWIALYEEARRTGKPISMEYARRDAKGQERWLLATASYVGTGRSGNPRFAYTALDLTERKQAEEALWKSEERLRLAQTCGDVGIWDWNRRTGALHFTPELEHLYGLAPGTIGSYQDWRRLAHPDDIAKVEAERDAAIANHKPFDLEFRVLHASGETRWLSAKGGAFYDSAGEATRVLGVNVDITERKRAEKALRESESQERARAAELSALMDAAPYGIFVAHDAECHHMTGNPAAYALLRGPAGSNLSKSAPDNEKPMNFRALKDGIEIPLTELPMQKAALTGQPIRKHEMDFVFDDGSVTNVLGDVVPLTGEDGRPRGAVGVFLDITELKRNEERLRESQKLESIGLLAGGIAHDFNNLLTSILGNASLIELSVPTDSAGYLKEVIGASEKAAALTRQLLAYAGKGKFVISDFDVVRLVRSSADLLRVSISRNIEIELEVPRNLPAVRGDSSQIQQIVMNLVLNAAEATEGRNDGRVRISAGVRDYDTATASHVGSGVAPGRFVWIRVQDNGCGMDEQTKAKIFEPFFTTKFTGRGLGLAAVQGILRSHKGTITVESKPGEGSTFAVYLPCQQDGAVESDRKVAATVSGPSATVLVVDDEEQILTFTKAALERFGYRVLVAHNGQQALDVLGNERGVDLVVLDVIMPVVGGVEAFCEMRRKWPELAVLVASGYSREEACRLGMPPDLPFLEKPYTLQILGAAVERSLKLLSR